MHAPPPPIEVTRAGPKSVTKGFLVPWSAFHHPTPLGLALAGDVAGVSPNWHSPSAMLQYLYAADHEPHAPINSHRIPADRPTRPAPLHTREGRHSETQCFIYDNPDYRK